MPSSALISLCTALITPFVTERPPRKKPNGLPIAICNNYLLTHLNDMVVCSYVAIRMYYHTRTHSLYRPCVKEVPILLNCRYTYYRRCHSFNCRNNCILFRTHRSLRSKFGI